MNQEKKWRCSENPEHIFESVGNGECPMGDGGVLIPLEETKSSKKGEGVIKYTGEHGLGILVFDMSQSMEGVLEEDSENPLTKIEAVANAFGVTIASLLYGGGGGAMKKPSSYFLALIGFSNNAELLDFYNIKSMEKGDFDSTRTYWKDYILKAFDSFRASTNITEALELAKEIYDQALNGNLPTSQYTSNYPDLKNFNLGSQNVVATEVKDSFEVPNVRILIYSDGEHNVDDFRNPFDKDDSFVPGLGSQSGRMVNGLISIYFGIPKTGGAKQMEEIAGFCPVHRQVGTIPISKLTHYKHLRRLLHLTSGASGFCIECARAKFE